VTDAERLGVPIMAEELARRSKQGKFLSTVRCEPCRLGTEAISGQTNER
jgi:hypothetical protein